MVANRVCVVDDHEFVFDLIKVSFEKNFPGEYDLTYFDSGNNFCNYIDNDGQVPCLLFLDMRMDDGDGVQVLKKLSTEGLSGLPIFIVSSLENDLISYVLESVSDYNLNIVKVISKSTLGSIHDEIKSQKDIINFGKGAYSNEYASLKNAELKKAVDKISAYEVLELDSYIKNSLTLYIQPKMNLKDSFITGFEVLARFIDPSYGIIAPSDFFEAIYDSERQFIFDINVINKSFETISGFQSRGYAFKFSINVDPVTLSSPSFLLELSKILSKFDLIKEHITFELTESRNVDTAALHTTIAQIKLKGFNISIDDFGKGFSNIDRITKIPYDEVKLDRKLTSKITSSESDKKLVESIVNFLKSKSRVKVVAEGVENHSTAGILSTIGCDEGQGFYYSYPKPIGELDSIIYQIFLSKISHILCYMEQDELSKSYNALFSSTLTDIDKMKNISYDTDYIDKFSHKLKGAISSAGLNDLLPLVNELKVSEFEYYNHNLEKLRLGVEMYFNILKARDFV